MSKSMWRCSGRHWLNVAAIWSAFAFCFATVLSTPPSTRADDAAEPATPIDIGVYVPNGRVLLQVSAFDLAAAPAESFGDHE